MADEVTTVVQELTAQQSSRALVERYKGHKPQETFIESVRGHDGVFRPVSISDAVVDVNKMPSRVDPKDAPIIHAHGGTPKGDKQKGNPKVNDGFTSVFSEKRQQEIEEEERKQKEAQHAAEQQRIKEEELRQKYIRDIAEGEAKRVVGSIYTTEGRRNTTQLMDQLVDVSKKGLFPKTDRVREQVLYSVDRLIDQQLSAESLGVLGYKLQVRWEKENPIGKHASRSEQDEWKKKKEEHFETVTQQLRDIAQALAYLARGRNAVRIPRFSGEQRKIVDSGIERKVYCDQFEKSWRGVQDKFTEDKNPPWYIIKQS
ncbi:hypothetical protein IPM62_02855 [Candidatus Woesebacteria bacterium]|nr:MAG: hypothetical protein IPM62_02855 [Candidatus Woesebacteria bacterium]